MNNRNKWRWIPLHTAAREGHYNVVRLLLDRGADVNAFTMMHWSVLHLATFNGREEITRLLLERGADVHAQNDMGRTPFQVVTKNTKKENPMLAQMLSEHGAKEE